MHTTRMHKAFWTLGLLLLLYTAIGIFGCGKIAEIDEAIWSQGVHTEEQVAAGDAPPIVEGIASALALLGYGGLAAWIRKNGKREARDVEAVHDQLTSSTDATDTAINVLDERIAALEAVDVPTKAP